MLIAWKNLVKVATISTLVSTTLNKCQTGNLTLRSSKDLYFLRVKSAKMTAGA